MLTNHPLISLIYIVGMVFLVLTGLVVWPVTVIRTSLREDIRERNKFLWVIGQILFFPICCIYLIFFEKKRIWKIIGGFLSAGLILGLLAKFYTSIVGLQ